MFIRSLFCIVVFFSFIECFSQSIVPGVELVYSFSQSEYDQLKENAKHNKISIFQKIPIDTIYPNKSPYRSSTTYPVGHYLIVSFDRYYKGISYHLKTVKDYNIDFFTTGRKVFLRLTDSTNHVVRDARVFGYKGELFLNPETDVYEVTHVVGNNIRIDRGGHIVEYNTRDWKLRKQHKEKLKKKDLSNGYVAFDKPKYKPGDTVRLKSLVLVKGKEFKKPLELIISSKGKELINEKIKTNKSSGYEFEFVIDDKFTVNRNYTVNLYTNKALFSVSASNSFYVEDYLLDNIFYTLDLDLVDSVHIVNITAKDASGLYETDNKYFCELIPTEVNNFYEELVYLPLDDMMYFGDIPNGKTSFSLNDTLNASISYTLNCSFTSSNGDKQYNSVSFINKKAERNTLSFLAKEAPQIKVSKERTLDSYKLNIENQNQQVYYLNVYEDNKLIIDKVLTKDTLINNPISIDKAVFYEITYFTNQSKANHISGDILPEIQKLTSDVTIPDKIYPREISTNKIQLSDYKNKPVKNTAVLVSSVNNKFRESNFPVLDYDNLSFTPKKLGGTRRYRYHEPDVKEVNKPVKASSDFDKYYNFFRLDTIKEYRAIYSKEPLIQFFSPSKYGITEVEILLKQDEKIYKPAYFSANGKVIEVGDISKVYNGTTIPSGKYNFDIRLRKKLVTLKNREIKEGGKTTIIIRTDYLKQKSGDIAIQKMPKKYKDEEKEMIHSVVYLFEKNRTGQNSIINNHNRYNFSNYSDAYFGPIYEDSIQECHVNGCYTKAVSDFESHKIILAGTNPTRRVWSDDHFKYASEKQILFNEGYFSRLIEPIQAKSAKQYNERILFDYYESRLSTRRGEGFLVYTIKDTNSVFLTKLVGVDTFFVKPTEHIPDIKPGVYFLEVFTVDGLKKVSSSFEIKANHLTMIHFENLVTVDSVDYASYKKKYHNVWPSKANGELRVRVKTQFDRELRVPIEKSTIENPIQNNNRFNYHRKSIEIPFYQLGDLFENTIRFSAGATHPLFLGDVSSNYRQSNYGYHVGLEYDLYTDRMIYHFVSNKRKKYVYRTSFSLDYSKIRLGGDDALSNFGSKEYIRNQNFRNDINQLSVGANYRFHLLKPKGSGIYTKYPIPVLFIARAGGIYGRSNPEVFYNGNWQAVQPLKTEGTSYGKNIWGAYIGIKIRQELRDIWKKLPYNYSLELGVDYVFTNSDYLDDVSGKYQSFGAGNLSANATDLSGNDRNLSQILADQNRSLVSTTEGSYVSGFGPGDKRGSNNRNDNYLLFKLSLVYTIYPAPQSMNAEDHNWGHSGHYKSGHNNYRLRANPSSGSFATGLAYNEEGSFTENQIDKVEESTELEKNTNPLRSNFTDVAIWQPALRTNKNGEVSFTTTFPDDITSWKTRVLAVSKRNQIAYFEKEIKSYKELYTILNAPRVLHEGDSCWVLTNTYNRSGESLLDVQASFVDAQGQQFLSNFELKDKDVNFHYVGQTEKDSVKLKYEVSNTKYADGEVRTIPILPIGLEKDTGNFYLLYEDTSITFSPLLGYGKVAVTIFDNMQQTLLDEMDKVIYSPYDCNEQMSSKLLMLLYQKKIVEAQGKSFTQNYLINKYIKQLENNQNESGGWSWWNKGESNFHMTEYVSWVLFQAQSKFNYEIKSLSAAKSYLKNVIENDSLVHKNIGGLIHLSEIGVDIDYDKYITQVDLANPYNRIRVIRLKQNLNTVSEEDYEWLLNQKQETFFGGVFWGEYEKYHWYDNSIHSTLLVYEILKIAGRNSELYRPISQYFLEKRRNYGWRNTRESVLIIHQLMDELNLDKSSQKQKLEFHFSDRDSTIKDLPTQFMLDETKPFTVQKEGSGALFMSISQHYFEPNPNPVVKDFDIKTSLFSSNGTKVDTLQFGEAYSLIVNLKPKKAGQYIMLTVPIPSGCEYDPIKRLGDGEVHREYFKDRVVVFYNTLNTTPKRVEVRIQARFPGKYALLPAKAELMYFPTFYGNNEVKSTVILK